MVIVVALLRAWNRTCSSSHQLLTNQLGVLLLEVQLSVPKRGDQLCRVRVEKAAFGWKIKLIYPKKKCFLLILVFHRRLFPSCQSPEKSFLYWKEAFGAEWKEPVFLRRRRCSGSHPPGLRRAAAGARRALRAAHAVGSTAVLRGGLRFLGRLGGSGRNTTKSTSTTATCGGRARNGVKTLRVGHWRCFYCENDHEMRLYMPIFSLSWKAQSHRQSLERLMMLDAASPRSISQILNRNLNEHLAFVKTKTDAYPWKILKTILMGVLSDGWWCERTIYCVLHSVMRPSCFSIEW